MDGQKVNDIVVGVLTLFAASQAYTFDPSSQEEKYPPLLEPESMILDLYEALEGRRKIDEAMEEMQILEKERVESQTKAIVSHQDYDSADDRVKAARKADVASFLEGEGSASTKALRASAYHAIWTDPAARQIAYQNMTAAELRDSKKLAQDHVLSCSLKVTL